MNMTLAEIARKINATIEGEGNIAITGPGKIEQGEQGTLGFFAHPKYESFLYTTACSGVLIPRNYRLLNPVSATLLRVDDVYAAMSSLMQMFQTELKLDAGVHPTASVHSSSSIDPKASVGENCIIRQDVQIGAFCSIHPNVFIGEGTRIGERCTIYPGVVIYHHTVIGDDCVIHANSVIGSDGFGFTKDASGKNQKIPQIGNVVIEDRVEIGAGTVIDRASLGSTLIGEGVKLDNLIQVGHNASIGKNTVIAAQTGISGSTFIEEDCMIGGQVGFAGHIRIARGSMIQAKSGISSNIKEADKKHYGYPAIAYQDYLRSYAYFKKLPDIVDKIRTLQMEVDALKQDAKKD